MGIVSARQRTDPDKLAVLGGPLGPRPPSLGGPGGLTPREMGSMPLPPSGPLVSSIGLPSKSFSVCVVLG